MPAGEKDLVIVYVECAVKQLDITPNFLVLEPQEVAIVAAESKDRLEKSVIQNGFLQIRALPTRNLEYKG